MGSKSEARRETIRVRLVDAAETRTGAQGCMYGRKQVETALAEHWWTFG